MKKFMTIFIILLVMLSNSACTFNLNHYEDKLYSEKSLDNYAHTTSFSNPNDFTRDNAIEKALTMFNAIFSTNIDRSKVSEFVNLSKNSDNNFEWLIIWDEPYKKERYECRIDPKDGKVLFMNHSYKVSPSNKPSKIATEELEALALPLIRAFDIDLNQYDLLDLKRGSKKIFHTPIVSLVYLNKTDSKNRIMIEVDYERKEVVSYLYLD